MLTNPLIYDGATVGQITPKRKAAPALSDNQLSTIARYVHMLWKDRTPDNKGLYVQGVNEYEISDAN